jgi:hypothetical protein
VFIAGTSGKETRQHGGIQARKVSEDNTIAFLNRYFALLQSFGLSETGAVFSGRLGETNEQACKCDSEESRIDQAELAEKP